MDNKEAEKTPIAVSKSFMAVGPTLHYSHRNVQRCWLLAVVAFSLSCFFWSKIATGVFWSFDFQEVTTPEFWRLGQSITTGLERLGCARTQPVAFMAVIDSRYCLFRPFVFAHCYFRSGALIRGMPERVWLPYGQSAGRTAIKHPGSSKRPPDGDHFLQGPASPQAPGAQPLQRRLDLRAEKG
jgi:hypothetical protein